jgi:hypothetical protein
MRTIYEANDGSQFNLKDECQHYELQTKLSKYKNYTELHKNVDNLWHDHIENNTDSLTMAAFIIDNIELLSTMIDADLKQVVKSGEFTLGQTILVRDYDWVDWKEKVFVRYEHGAVYPYICQYTKCHTEPWKYAKSI